MGDEVEYTSILVEHLNELLHILDIQLSIPIESPTDLTPSLLMVILESILGTRVSLGAYALTHSHAGPPYRGQPDIAESMKRIHNMKLFLGVLEHDVLAMDVGLSDIDPRRLARGEWEEVVYVAEILCWIGIWLREAQDDEYDATVVFDGESPMPKGKRKLPPIAEVEDDDDFTIGLGIYESSTDYAPPKVQDAYCGLPPELEASPSLLSNDLSSDVDLNASFTLRGASVCCSECGREPAENFFPSAYYVATEG